MGKLRDRKKCIYIYIEREKREREKEGGLAKGK
jgi:hypothetical protein